MRKYQSLKTFYFFGRNWNSQCFLYKLCLCKLQKYYLDLPVLLLKFHQVSFSPNFSEGSEKKIVELDRTFLTEKNMLFPCRAMKFEQEKKEMLSHSTVKKLGHWYQDTAF